ncbi:Rieske (2Fe-2S) protein [Rhizobium tropici]|uniref:Rieske (2Fe-2S) protein n=1 Tax=Rhizobium tropici TaxID=398 RepID=A0A329YAJ5_RHITR|nr:Rieske 2Fe-2S domain-containing protein [Rhizobium tropici]RAX41159.1 Rieske (2Fe-2S) protein [Rhizobium tropici]
MTALDLHQVGLCRTEDIGEGKARGFGPVGGYRRKIIVLRKEGRLHAWLDACPHYPQGTPMAWRSNAYLNGDGTHIACHSHGALFDMETGECVLGPCLGQGLTRVELTVTEEGEVFAALAEEEKAL